MSRGHSSRTVGPAPEEHMRAPGDTWRAGVLIDALESGADTFTAEEAALAGRSYGRDTWTKSPSAVSAGRAADGAAPADGSRQVARQAGSAELPELVVKADALMRGGASGGSIIRSLSHKKN